MPFNWTKLQRPIVALSPMADLTDSAFCRMVKTLADPIIFREMISAEGIVRGNKKTLAMAKIHKDERPLIQQIFGCDPAVMAKAAAIIEKKFKPDGIDLNMGCPVYKLVHTFNGAALMRDPKLAAQIVRAVKAAVKVPVSVKIRAGWSDPNECIEFAKILEKAGADLISIHGRTKTQGYSGAANWEVIGQAKRAVKIPILANGDIFSPELAAQALKITGADGILIARGALGNPWIFAQTERLLSGQAYRPTTMEERVQTVKKHAQLHCALHGDRGVVTFRKHLSWYFKGQPGAKKIREQLVRVSSLMELDELLDQLPKRL